MISRTAHDTLLRLAKGFPVLALTGPRQSGKTTLAKAAFPDKPYLTLEDPDLRALAETDPRGGSGGSPLLEGQTVAADYFDGLTKWTGLAGRSGQPSWLVDGGDLALTRAGVQVVPWRELPQLDLLTAP